MSDSLTWLLKCVLVMNWMLLTPFVGIMRAWCMIMIDAVRCVVVKTGLRANELWSYHYLLHHRVINREINDIVCKRIIMQLGFIGMWTGLGAAGVFTPELVCLQLYRMNHQ